VPRIARPLVLTLALISAIAWMQPASAVNTPQPIIVSADPAGFTPQVRDGKVNAIVQVGSTIVAGGVFTEVKQPGGAWLPRSNLFAFNATTGQISSFAPTLDGEVLTLATDGTNVFAGGRFGLVNQVQRRRLVKLNLSGQVVTTFNARITSGAAVYDMAVANGLLYLGGAISKFGTTVRNRFAAVNPASGALDANANVSFLGKHNGGTVRIHKLDVSPNGQRMVVIGNFLTANGLDRHQIAILDLTTGPVSVTGWSTQRYVPQCNARFDTYLRDIDISPDGSYFVIGTTGAYMGGPNAGVLCDTVSRWPLGPTGPNQEPTWVDYTGGDTTYSVASTGTAIYVGGHQRWWNNAYASDREGPGAVTRFGIAALDPVNGLPFNWNPTRDPRGEGVFALVATSQGLWVGSDTNRIGGESHQKIAFMPLAGGTSVPVHQPATLPGTLFTLPSSGSGSLARRSFNGTTSGAVSTLSTPGVDWSQARGAFITNGRIYAGWSDGHLYSRTFDGSTVGPAVDMDLHGLTAGTPSFFPVSSVTGMFFDAGRLYYTVSGDPNLYYRYFTPESEVVGAQRFVAHNGSGGLMWGDVRGMALAAGKLYFARSNGTLFAVTFSGGVPNPATLSTIDSSPAQAWASRGMFVRNP
jgi:hypothetical protein